VLLLFAEEVELLAVVLEEMGADAEAWWSSSVVGGDSCGAMRLHTYSSTATSHYVDLASEVWDVLVGIKGVAAAEHCG